MDQKSSHTVPSWNENWPWWIIWERSYIAAFTSSNWWNKEHKMCVGEDKEYWSLWLVRKNTIAFSLFKFKSNFKTAKILIEHGANVNALTNDMESPLTILASQKKKDIRLLKLMLNRNAKKEHENKNQMRAIDFVQQSKCKEEIIKLLQPQ